MRSKPVFLYFILIVLSFLTACVPSSFDKDRISRVAIVSSTVQGDTFLQSDVTFWGRTAQDIIHRLDDRYRIRLSSAFDVHQDPVFQQLPSKSISKKHLLIPPFKTIALDDSQICSFLSKSLNVDAVASLDFNLSISPKGSFLFFPASKRVISLRIELELNDPLGKRYTIHSIGESIPFDMEAYRSGLVSGNDLLIQSVNHASQQLFESLDKALN